MGPMPVNAHFQCCTYALAYHTLKAESHFRKSKQRYVSHVDCQCLNLHCRDLPIKSSPAEVRRTYRDEVAISKHPNAIQDFLSQNFEAAGR